MKVDESAVNRIVQKEAKARIRVSVRRLAELRHALTLTTNPANRAKMEKEIVKEQTILDSWSR